MRQPPPKPTPESVPVMPYVIRRGVSADVHQMLHKRYEQGIDSYGVPLVTHNGRSAHLDALEEMLDAMLYMQQYELETGAEVGGMIDDMIRLTEQWIEKAC